MLIAETGYTISNLTLFIDAGRYVFLKLLPDPLHSHQGLLYFP